MSYTKPHTLFKTLIIFAISFWQTSVVCSQSTLDTLYVTIPSDRMDYLETFMEIGKQTGFYFMYESQLLSADQRTPLRKKQYTLSEIISILVNGNGLEYKTMDRYIILYKPVETRQTTEIEHEPPPNFSAKGRVMDIATGDPLPSASVLLAKQNKGVSSNAEGIFRFNVPAEFLSDSVKITFMGYAPRWVPVSLLVNEQMDIYMEVESVELQEIMIHWYDPEVILDEAIEKIPVNYPSRPTLHTTFYREGTFKDERMLNYSEAIFHVYKPGYATIASDQVRLLKTRNIINANDSDTLMLKLKGGVKSVLELDVIKFSPHFLSVSDLDSYVFTPAGYEWHNTELVYVVEFETAPTAPEKTYHGRIYIERDTRAIVRVDFGVKSEYLRRNQKRFLPRRSKNHVTRIISMDYSVYYQPMGNFYYITHVRGDIVMRIRERGKISGKRFSAFFEMATLEVDTANVERFRARERLRTNAIFAENDFNYDQNFWEGFSFIPPEESVYNAIQLINARIESASGE
ncbi:MAG: STN and carboxypeptidase regulatory-like domain-containing protein [Bacteroidota bacterium]